MNLSPRWVSLLCDSGFETVHWSTVGNAGASDAEVMTYAAAHGYVVLTHDLDFGTALSASQSGGPSVVQIRADDISPGALASDVVSALRKAEEDLEQGALLTIEPSRARLRLLPLRRKQQESP